MSNLADLDREDQALLASLKPEGVMPGSDPNDLPAEEGDPAAAPAAPAPAPAADAPAPSPAPAAPAPAPAASAPAPAAAPAAAAPAPAEHQGDVRGALRAARAAEKRLKEALAAKDAELQALREKVGTPADEQRDPEDYTDEQLAELKENFPLQYRMVMDLRDLKARVPAPSPAPAAPAPAAEWQAPEFEPVVQEVIDQVPQLQAWQYSKADQDKFDMAAQFDEALRHHPDWKTKTPVERFAEAARLTQERFKTAPAPASQADPAALAAQRIASAPATPPAAIHDFRGGAPAAAPALDFRGMSDEAILASLKPEA